MWNLKKKKTQMNKRNRNRNRLIDAENKPMEAGGGEWGVDDKVTGTESLCPLKALQTSH